MKKIFFLLLIIVLISCKKEELPNYSEIPTIKFKSIDFSKRINIVKDIMIVIKLTLFYTDGDSNLGGNYFSNDTYHEDGEYLYDCIVKLHKKRNGELELLNINPENPIYMYFPEISSSPIDFFNTIKVRPYNIVEGEMEIILEFYEHSNLFESSDTLNFTFQILDRDYNFSNIAEIEKIYSLSR